MQGGAGSQEEDNAERLRRITAHDALEGSNSSLTSLYDNAPVFFTVSG